MGVLYALDLLVSELEYHCAFGFEAVHSKKGDCCLLAASDSVVRLLVVSLCLLLYSVVRSF